MVVPVPDEPSDIYRKNEVSVSKKDTIKEQESP